MNYYISDLHIGHANVTAEGTDFDGRSFKTLEEMHSAIINNWNNTITNADHIYILGDLAWKVNDETISIVSRLRGNKHLILGNHDSIKDSRYSKLFVEITEYKEVTDCIDKEQYRVVMSHFPIMFWNKQHILKSYGEERKCPSIHLYGHLHNGVEESYYQSLLQQVNTDLGRKGIAINVGCMLHDHTPKTLKQLMEGGKYT